MSNQTITHLGIVLDGNRRYAKKMGLQPWKGHELGAETLQKALNWIEKRGVTEITLYVFSTENFKREKMEVDMLMNIFVQRFNKMLKDPDIVSKSIKVQFIGNLSLFNDKVKKVANALMKHTAKHNKLTLNFLFGYGGREELTTAIQQIAKKVKSSKLKPDQITPQLIQQHLYLTTEPDAVIRTGGAIRTSNFLPWQSIYSEWFFTEKLWPQIEESDFDKIFAEFAQRKRNYGK